ncbi:MAG: hypothetical protein CVU97_03025 [Firmicutes bacterium HGW-Firmicutes-21]|nr:MAG: hypothetical protein CVU97_03025 [Firmicutes bacterium HGW-Firmicutes-21]
MELLITLTATFFASLFFGLSLSAPKRTLFVAPVLGLTGYLVFTLINNATGSEYSAAFFGTLAACIPAEVFARIIKTPATVIIFISVIPLVPGMMLYQSMLFFAQNNFTSGTYEIIRTLVYSGCMAIAITVSTVLGKQLLTPLFKRINAKKIGSKH